MVELDALARMAIGKQTAWDVIAADALAVKCFDEGCTIANGDVESHPGWCSIDIAGFEGWAMTS